MGMAVDRRKNSVERVCCPRRAAHLLRPPPVPGWHPFLNDGADQDDESRPMTFVAAGGRLTISIHLMRKGKLNSALCWRRAPSGGRFIEWSHHLSAWWYFHEHFGPTGKNDKPASSDIAVKLVLVAEPDQGRARD
jgi:hypothetical protein